MREDSYADGGGADFREVFRAWEREAVGPIPDFEHVRRHISRSPSLDLGGRRAFGQSMRLTLDLAIAQARVVPWVVAPVALGLGALAMAAGRLLAANGGTTMALAGFSSVVLAGVVLTVTMAMACRSTDEITLTTPLRPQVVVLARLLLVLAHRLRCIGHRITGRSRSRLRSTTAKPNNEFPERKESGNDSQDHTESDADWSATCTRNERMRGPRRHSRWRHGTRSRFPEPTPLSPSLSVTVEVESDSPVSGELSISIDGATDSQSVEEGSVDLPYSAVFDVPSDAPFPYRGSRVEVSAAQDASWIECRILMDEKVVASHRAEGSNARAVCERNLRLGPS